MTTKRTHGPCGAECAAFRAAQKSSPVPLPGHLAGCPSLYPAQQEPDALTRLARYLRESTLHEVEKDEALSLISEAREEQRKAKFNREEVERLRDGVTRAHETIVRERKRADDAEDKARDLMGEVRRLTARLHAYEAPE